MAKSTSKTQDNLPLYLFHQGTNYKSYEFLGAHPCKKGKVQGYVFRVWAPNAAEVSVVGNFNGWDPDANPMELLEKSGVWELMIPDLAQYDIYKYCIKTRDGRTLMKSDPYAFHAETAPDNASKLYDIEGYEWKDKDWYDKRKDYNPYRSPVNIYELHMGSWRRHEDGNPYSYRQVADELVSYLKEMGYNYVEFLPLMEYPFDGSWGYQVTGFFAPTSRYGVPKDFMYFVDKCHKEGIGVILDWVVAHFPKDEHGLMEFDGSRLYEYTDELKCEHKEWGTRIFDYSKNEVKSFLISSAMYWLGEYHIDGIRVDAVASMLYLDYGRQNGQWRPNCFGGNYNLEAIDFLKELNKTCLTAHKGALMIAEESTAFPMVTKPTEDGGLGFNYKWNMGWMNDMLSYASLDPFFRKDNHNKVTFSITYAYSENYILPLSHDEVVHGKCSMIGKMPLYYDDKFEELKAFYGYMIGHPGKKLSFMGNEFGQFIEWNYKQGLDWLLLDYDKHRQLQDFVKALNKYYLDNKEMYEQDCSYDGFKWLVVDDREQNIVSFVRYAKDGDFTVVVVNFSPVKREKYDMGVPKAGSYSAKLDSSLEKFGGHKQKSKSYKAKKGNKHGQDYYITLEIEPNSVMFFKCK